MQMGYLFGQKRRKVGRLQRQAARCFFVTQEASSAKLGTWCWPRVVLIEKRFDKPDSPSSRCTFRAYGILQKSMPIKHQCHPSRGFPEHLREIRGLWSIIGRGELCLFDGIDLQLRLR